MAGKRNPPPEAGVDETAVGLSVHDRLKELDIDDETIVKIIEDLGVESLEDLGQINEFDLTNTVGMKPIQARNLLAALAPPAPEVEPAQPVDMSGVLPQVPNYDSLLEMLKTGGVLKVESSTLIAAAQASIADHAGLFTIPDKLAKAMLKYATDNEEPVDKTYYNLKRQLTRRSYGDLFAAIEGFDGRNVTDAGKQHLFAGINSHIWPATLEYFQVLNGWMDAWVKSSNNPALLMSAIASMAGGGAGVGPAVGQAPDTGGLRLQADKFNDAANRAFAGEGVQIAAAVAYDASEIRKTLSDARLPSLVGAANNEQMLKLLGISVSAADPKFETDVTKFVMSIMQVKNLAGGNDELMYFNAQYMLGSQIPWNHLGGNSSGLTGIGGREEL